MKLHALIQEFNTTCCGGTLTAAQVQLLLKTNGDDVEWTEEDEAVNSEETNTEALTKAINAFFLEVKDLEHKEVIRILRQLASKANVEQVESHQESLQAWLDGVTRYGRLEKLQREAKNEKDKWLKKTQFMKMKPTDVPIEDNLVLQSKFYSQQITTPVKGPFIEHWKNSEGERYSKAEALCNELGDDDNYLLKLCYYRMHDDDDETYGPRPPKYRLLFNLAWVLVCHNQRKAIWDPEKLNAGDTWPKMPERSIVDILKWLGKILRLLNTAAEAYEKP